MSGSGKSFYAEYLNNYLSAKHYKINLLDGDIIRDRYKTSIGFSYDEICQNNLTIADSCYKEYKDYDFSIISVISPYEHIRKKIRKLFKKDILFIYIHSDIESLVSRDTKGLYKKARDGEISNLIGYSDDSLYETPVSPDLTINTTTIDDPDKNFILLKSYIDEIISK